jgi:hypothetical protein
MRDRLEEGGKGLSGMENTSELPGRPPERRGMVYIPASWAMLVIYGGDGEGESRKCNRPGHRLAFL